MSRYFKVTSEYDIGSESNPYELFVKTDNVNKIHRHLEDYCCSVGLDYHESLDDGLFNIKEVSLDEVVLVL